MKKLSVIKSAKSLNMVTNLYAKKITNVISYLSNYQVKTEDCIKGKINHIIVLSEESRMLTKPAIDSVWGVVDELEKKYDKDCICATIQTRPYLTKDGSTFLHQPVIEIMVRVKEI